MKAPFSAAGLLKAVTRLGRAGGNAAPMIVAQTEPRFTLPSRSLARPIRASLTAEDLRLVLRSAVCRPTCPFRALADDETTAGTAIRLDAGRGLTAALHACLHAVEESDLAPWVLVRVAGELGYGREGNFVLDPLAAETLETIARVNTGPLGLLADPAACITQFQRSPLHVWRQAAESLAARGVVLEGFGTPFRSDPSAQLDRIWVYRACGRLPQEDVLGELDRVPLQCYEWLFEETAATPLAAPSDGIRSLTFRCRPADRPVYRRSHLAPLPVEVETATQLSLDFVLHTDATGWRLLRRDGNQEEITTQAAVELLDAAPPTARIGVVVDPDDIAWPLERHAAANRNSTPVRTLPYPFDRWLAVSSDIDWSDHAHLDATLRAVCDEHGLHYGNSAYLVSRDPRWPAWVDLACRERRSSSPPSGPGPEWIACGAIDTVHGLAHSFDCRTLLDSATLADAPLTIEFPLPMRLDGYDGLLLTANPTAADPAPPRIDLELTSGERLALHASRRYEPNEPGTRSDIYPLPARDGLVARRITVQPSVQPITDVRLQPVLATEGRVRELAERLRAWRLAPPVFTAHGGGQGVQNIGQLTTAAGLAVYPERAALALDAPGTPWYALPHLRRAGVVFFNPMDRIFAPGLVGIDRVLSRERAQDGSTYYTFSRFQYQPPDGGSAAAWAHGKHAATAQAFPAVVSEALRQMRHGAAGDGCIIYTHLGNRVGNQASPRLGWTEETHAAWQTLAEHVHARDRDHPVPFRLWLAPASCVLTYAALRRGLDANLTVSGNVVRIRSWHDEAVGEAIPAPDVFATSWLHGLTIYVPDPPRADVRVDHTSITHFTRNPPDESGRASITLVDVSGRVALLPGFPEDYAIDPAGGWRAELPTENSPLTIVHDGQGAEEVVIPISGIPLRNATHWTFEVWIDGSPARWSVGFQTEAGNRFEAGNRDGCQWHVEADGAGRWTRVTLPLFDHSGADMANGQVRAVRVTADRAVACRFRDLSMLVPRPCRRKGVNARILSGRARDALTGVPLAGLTVLCRAVDGERRAVTDAAGRYLFESLPDDTRCRIGLADQSARVLFHRGATAWMTCDQWDWDLSVA